MSPKRRGPVLDAVDLEVYRHRFAAIAEEMGAALQHSAFSPNIKERRDFSCALFDEHGDTVAQGDHMPVHLGSMPDSVRAALADCPPGPGDMILLNDPYRGGTHLPDLTLVAALWHARRPILYVASRAHHSDVGGSRPGSMPLAREIFEEGLRLPPVRIVQAGQLNDDLLRVLLANVRTPEERRGDLLAQVAANRTGLKRLEELCEKEGAGRILMAARELMAYSERRMRAILRSIPNGTYRATDTLDPEPGHPAPVLRVRVRIAGGKAGVDFSGTHAQLGDGRNAVASITRSAVFYVFRCLAGADLPTNAGAWRPLDIRVPAGSLLDARPPAAVAAGNVETSQRIVDLLLRALARALPGRIPAASQGTMNNLTLGGVAADGTPFTYYETMAGGMGARPGADGLSGVHTHMTNSLNTPIEALEHALPVRLRRYGLRRGSGGAGRYRGGDGLVREIEILADVECTLLAERRCTPPWGLRGGKNGAPGRDRVQMGPGEKWRTVPGRVSLRLQKGSVLKIETPGGGGWGRAQKGRRRT
ncbi:MAG: hydantoinase B/oxoprolinase family protein [Acidobacteria bacterium]|nr:hydantoinase B/oxoprolinase family protein [Acidobacteriota bacterium]